MITIWPVDAAKMDYSNLPELQRLPSYATTDSRHPTVHVNDPPNLSVPPEKISPTDGDVWDIHKTSRGLDVRYGDNQLYWIGVYNSSDEGEPDLAIHGGFDATGPRLAQAKLIPQSRDLRIYVGSLKTPGKWDWDVVHCASDGALVRHADSYIFDAFATVDRERIKRRLRWTKTHNTKLGASSFSGRCFKLVDDGSGKVLAVYTEHGLNRTGKLKGKVDLRQRLGEEIELAALMAVMAIVEKMDRTLRRVGSGYASIFKG